MDMSEVPFPGWREPTLDEVIQAMTQEGVVPRFFCMHCPAFIPIDACICGQDCDVATYYAHARAHMSSWQ